MNISKANYKFRYPSITKGKKFICYLLLFLLFFQSISSITVTATEYEEDAAKRLEEPIESNEIMSWPTGPVVGAQGAILFEANTGTILYSKNIHERLYPASTTKILTTLVAIENSKLSDMVEFSADAVFSIEQGSSNMGMDVGQSITMEQCLYGILVYSANEVANAVGEHIAGNTHKFVDMMNQKARELGCSNSHFVTTNGLHDENHYTSSYDLALIAQAFFKNETLSKIAGTRYYKIEPTDTQPDLIELYTHNQLTNGTYEYEGYVGGKTGYTTVAHQTLVSCAERNGMKLICVVMKEDSPSQFTDTIALFDYGFQNFQMVNVAENEKNYIISGSDFFENNNAIFGNNETILSINPNDYIVVPNHVDFSELSSQLTYDEGDSNETAIATISYSYQGIPIGSAQVELAKDTNYSYDFESPTINSLENSGNTSTQNIIFVNVVRVIGIVLGIVLFLILIIFLRSVCKNYHFARHKKQRHIFRLSRKERWKNWTENRNRKIRIHRNEKKRRKRWTKR